MIKPFEFTVSPNDLKALRDGLASPFWDVFKKVLLDEKQTAEAAVFENEDLNDEQRDDLRLRRNLLAYIIDLPDLIIEKSHPKKEQKEPDMETYA